MVAWLYILCGVFGLLTGVALGVLAAGTLAAVATLTSVATPANPAVWLLVISGASAAVGGALMIVAGRGLLRRARFARPLAIGLAILSLLVVPFGTALGIYGLWALVRAGQRLPVS